LLICLECLSADIGRESTKQAPELISSLGGHLAGSPPPSSSPVCAGKGHGRDGP
jgi:hypothetical protein